ncbi:uncharacterized protein EAF01_010963 [Botrytis porri]|uniref:Uncharacterized protein n=1 Tax=Botrytis porri TaxID=87229 RepID=A0A4Z1KIH9_9HELO|nr:uncharacterized protein EAF01_010963 [Botrytis porri]KAF7887809.1 hypothetical protein EAF01_010963 [Botrytis porri]TGO80963.1 hypothetical protein BPOR_1476g00020 [Botrytis porri]
MSGSNRHLDWKDILLCYPIFHNVCAHLDPNDIMLFRLTTTQLSPSFNSLFKTQWNINRQLTRFVQDPVGFRSRLAKHDALISGSFALQFFERRFWLDSDLDIYVQGANNFRDPEQIGKYLIKHEGYKLQGSKTEANGGLMNYVGKLKYISQVESYIRTSSIKKKSIQIQIIYTTNVPFQAIIQGFGTSLLMNVISWDFAYSLFPNMNFIKRTAYEVNGGDNRYLQANANHEDPEAKYRSRGWEWEKAAAIGDPKNLHSLNLASCRKIDDSYTWTIGLDTNDVNGGQPSYLLQNSYFKVAQLGLSNTQYFVDMNIKLDDLTHTQLLKIFENERPIPLRTCGSSGYKIEYNSRTIKRRVQELKGWIFYDDQIPTWYKEYLEDEEARLRAKKEMEHDDLELSLNGEAEILAGEGKRL